MVDDFNVLTGYPLGHHWQTQHGALAPGHRLIPKQPFVLGGAFDTDNLYSLDAVEGMRFRGELARQITGLPDGTAIEIRVTDT